METLLGVRFLDDQHAVQQIPRNIELLRYKFFGDDLLPDLVNPQTVPDASTTQAPATSVPSIGVTLTPKTTVAAHA
jgi:hypothetical protein